MTINRTARAIATAQAATSRLMTWLLLLSLGIDAPAVAGERTQPRPVSFTNEVMAVLGKSGCNAGACHGHNTGKGGFKLSLRGYNPTADHQAIVRDLMGRRVNWLRPEASLLLLKPSAQVQHGGGKRFGPQSDSFILLRDWIAEGTTSDVGRATKLERIEVFPDSRMLTP